MARKLIVVPIVNTSLILCLDTTVLTFSHHTKKRLKMTRVLSIAVDVNTSSFLYPSTTSYMLLSYLKSFEDGKDIVSGICY